MNGSVIVVVGVCSGEDGLAVIVGSTIRPSGIISGIVDGYTECATESRIRNFGFVTIKGNGLQFGAVGKSVLANRRNGIATISHQHLLQIGQVTERIVTNVIDENFHINKGNFVSVGGPRSCGRTCKVVHLSIEPLRFDAEHTVGSHGPCYTILQVAAAQNCGTIDDLLFGGLGGLIDFVGDLHKIHKLVIGVNKNFANGGFAAHDCAVLAITAVQEDAAHVTEHRMRTIAAIASGAGCLNIGIRDED